MSGFVTGISISPIAPYDIYVHTAASGLYRFDRTAKQWLYLLKKFPTNAGAKGVESIAVDPVDPSTVYASFSIQNSNDGDSWTYTGEVWKSTDRGATWSATGLKLANVSIAPDGEQFTGTTGERLAIDPNKPDILWYASRNNGVWKKNGAAAWAQVAGLPDPTALYQGTDSRLDKAGFTYVIFDKSSGTSGTETPVVYIGAYGSGVFKRSTVGGAWTNLSGQTEGEVQKEPLRGAIGSNSIFYGVFGDGNPASNRGSMQRYSNSAWDYARPDDAASLSGIAIHPDTQQVLLSGNEKIWKSPDRGVTWQRCESDMRSPQNTSAPGHLKSAEVNGSVVAIAFDPADPNSAWFTNASGIARSSNANTTTPTWKWETLGLDNFRGVMTIAPPTPLNNYYIYSAVQTRTGFKHTNLNAPPSKIIAATGIPVPPNTESWIVANGTSTFPAPIDSRTGCSSIDVAWTLPQQAAYVGYHYERDQIPMYGKTDDHGETWQAFGSAPVENGNTGRGGQIAVDRRGTSRMVWVPCNFSPYYTIDGGNTWNVCKRSENTDNVSSSRGNNISPSVRSNVLAADRRINGRFYYLESTWTGLFYVSNDGGMTFTLTSQGQIPTNKTNVNIRPNPFVDNDVWISFGRDEAQIDAKGSKPWRSTNGGTTLQEVTTVDSCEYVAIGLGEDTIPYYVYIFGRANGDTTDALYRSIDLGATWQRLSDPNTNRFNGMSHLSADPRIANLIYTSALGRSHQYSVAGGVSIPSTTPSPTI